MDETGEATSASCEDVAAVRRDARALRHRLLETHPQLELTPVPLDDADPPLVRALWQELGWCGQLADAVGWPDRADSQRRAGRWSPDPEWWRPPERYRVCLVDGESTSLVLTDETGGAPDPPVVAACWENREIWQYHPSYLGWVAENLHWYTWENQVGVSCQVHPDPALVGGQPYPRLAPEIRQLTDTVWASPETVFEGSWWRLSARRFADLVDWLATANIEQITVRLRPRLCTALARFDPDPVLRTLAGQDGERYHVGYLEDIPVIVTEGSAVSLATSAAHRDRVERLIGERHWC